MTVTVPESRALRHWFLGSDSYWRAFGIDIPVPSSGTPSVLSPSFTARVTGKQITVDATASTASTSTITGYDWDFGDGTTGTGITAGHLYAAAGMYPVALTVTDDRNGSATTSQTVTVSAPTAAYTWTASTSTASFNATSSTDVGATITSYRWDFGDGTAAGSGVTVSHTYATAGTRAVTLTVTDTAGNSDTETQQVTVNLPVSNPVAAFTTAVSNYVATFDGSPSTTTNATITSYAWTYGDGITGTGRTSQHTYPAGNWTATLTITDSQGHTATISHLVAVLTPPNQPPTAAFTATATNLAAAFSAVTSTDGDGTITGYAWTYGDGGTGTGVTPTHTYAAAGSYPVRLTVTDNLGAQGTTTKTLTVTAPPVKTTDYITSATASKSSTLVPASTAAVLQDFARSPDTGQFYSSQVHPEPNGDESTRLSRMTSAGVDIDQMLLTGAGHGTVFALEYRSGTVWVWLTWRLAADGVTVVEDIVRFPYRAGTYTRSQVAGLTVMIPGGGAYRHVAFDWMNGYAAIRTSGGTTDTYRRHKLADVLAGNLSAPLNTVSLRQSTNFGVDGLQTMQGYATYAGALFRYTGAPTDIVGGDPQRITEYDWTTGATVRTLDTSTYGDRTQKLEPEGLSVYDNGTNPVLFFGVTQGDPGAHTYPTWWYPLLDTTTSGQPTGAGIIRYQDLTSTAKFSTKVNTAGTGNMVSFPAGTFTFRDFSDGDQTIHYGAFAFGAKITAKGLLGSGVGNTVIEMVANTSTKAGDVPPDGTFPATNNLTTVWLSTAGAKVDGLTLQATAQGHLHSGLRFDSVASPIFTNAQVNGFPGDSGSPPGETCNVDFQRTTGTATITDVTIDGQNTSAIGIASNSASGTFVVKNFTAKNLRYSAGWASWQQSGPMTFTNWRATNCCRHFNAERLSGAVTFINPIWNDPFTGHYDSNYTWETGYTGGSLTFKFTTATDWQNFIAGRTKKKITIVMNSHGLGPIASTVKVYVGGVQQTTTDYVAFTGS